MYPIDIQELVKVYNPRMKKGGIVALDAVDLTLNEGEIVGLLGPNGAGKTTLFKSVIGLVTPTSGRVAVFGFPVQSPQAVARVGFLPENHRFPPYHTSKSLLRLAGALHGITTHEAESRASELLPLVGMDKWADTPLKKYSKGMLQRIGLAQALIADPDILLLDEPTDGIDPVGKSEILALLTRLRDRGKSILLSSHLLAEVESVADRVVVLSRGKVIRTGTVSEFVSRGTQYEVEARMGNLLFEVPAEVGRVLAITDRGIIIELTHTERINDVIDLLRLRQISIQSVRPIKVSLEQSFLETVGSGAGRVPVKAGEE